MRLHHRLPRVTAIVTLLAILSLASYFAVATGPTASAAPRYATTVTSRGPVNPAAIPLGDGYVSTSPKKGYVDSCITNFPKQGGSSTDGPWINTTTKTWDSLTKTAVEGTVSWPQASFSVTVSKGLVVPT